MKIRNDYVSNSSSCSFIIQVQNEDDKKQLAKHEDIMKKYAREVSNVFSNVPYGDCLNFESVDKLNIGDFIRIYLCEDNDGWDLDSFRDFNSELVDIYAKLDEGYEKLHAYVDNDAHYTIGEVYRKKRLKK